MTDRAGPTHAPIPARYLDGATSRERPVRVRLSPAGRLHIEGLEAELTLDMADLKVRPRLGDTPRAIELPGGARLEVDDNDAVDAALEAQGRGRGQRLVHALEGRGAWVAAAVLLTVVAAWLVVGKGMPWLAARAAEVLPPGVGAAASRQALDFMDRSAFGPSALPEGEQARVETLFARVTEGAPSGYDYRVLLRAAPGVGANAFALPDGAVVVTDEIAQGADDDALLGVLAHEVGHVLHRHALRQVIQNTGATLLIGAVTGDVVSTSTLAAGLPVVLLEAHYSRAFETEADDYALGWMRAHDVSPQPFAALLEHLDAGNVVPAYLSTHPATADRIARLEAAAP